MGQWGHGDKGVGSRDGETRRACGTKAKDVGSVGLPLEPPANNAARRNGAQTSWRKKGSGGDRGLGPWERMGKGGSQEMQSHPFLPRP